MHTRTHGHTLEHTHTHTLLTCRAHSLDNNNDDDINVLSVVINDRDAPLEPSIYCVYIAFLIKTQLDTDWKSRLLY